MTIGKRWATVALNLEDKRKGWRSPPTPLSPNTWGRPRRSRRAWLENIFRHPAPSSAVRRPLAFPTAPPAQAASRVAFSRLSGGYPYRRNRRFTNTRRLARTFSRTVQRVVTLAHLLAHAQLICYTPYPMVTYPSIPVQLGQRIVVVGLTSSGKSTLASQLAKRFMLPH